MYTKLIQKSRLVFLLLSIVFLGSCSDENLTSSHALNLIENQLSTSPVYETTSINLGKVKLKIQKDAQLIDQYRTLEKNGYLSFADQQTKKKWLVKDSIWNTVVSLTNLAAPYVINQKSTKVSLKTIEYQVDKDQPIQINHKGKRNATITVMLFKRETPFAGLGTDKNPNTNFITRKFKLKYDEKLGWQAVK